MMRALMVSCRMMPANGQTSLTLRLLSLVSLYRYLCIYLISINLILKTSTEFSGIEPDVFFPYAKPEGKINIPAPFSSIRGIPNSIPQ